MQANPFLNLLIDQVKPVSDESRVIKRLLNACVRERLLSYKLQQQRLTIDLPHNKKKIVIDHVRNDSLQKFKMKGEVKLISGDQSFKLTELQTLLVVITQELQDSIEPKQWQVFLQEMKQCAVHETLSFNQAKKYNEHLKKLIQQSGHLTLIDYLREHYSAEQQIVFFEQWAASGHPYHPCHKTKLGFNTEAILQYAPEFHQDIVLHLGAMAKSVASVISLGNVFDYCAWFAAEFPDQWVAWQAKLQTLNLSSTDFVPFFVHPWQFQNIVKPLFSELFTREKLFVFTDVGLSTKPSSSFRTLIPADTKAHIKLPVAVFSTSTLRTVSPASIHNGPACSKLLRDILAKEDEISRYCRLAEDICGVHVLGYESDTARNLSVLYRQNPVHHLQAQQMSILVAALFEISPATQLPLFIELLQNAVGPELEAAKKYFMQYCQVKLRAFFDLYLLYGIVLDAHQQNTLTVFENNHPVFMIIRDLGDIRLHMPTLNAAYGDFQVYPSAITTNDVDEATKKFIHCILQYHLGELVIMLADYYNVPETEFWSIVKQTILERFEAIRDRISPEYLQQISNMIFAEKWRLKGLMRMRMHNQNTDYIYIDFNNPLRG